jgi:hypothetical protein
MENKYNILQDEITPEKLFNAEADSYFCFSLFLTPIQNYFLKNFKEIHHNISWLEKWLQFFDKELFDLFVENQIEIFHFAFTWNFCLLMREFPVLLSIKLIDYYLTEDIDTNQFCLFLILALILKFASTVKNLTGEDILLFFQNIPTFNWGFQDIQLLVSEAFIIKHKISAFK